MKDGVCKYVVVNGVRSTESLKYLQPGESREFPVQSEGKSSVLADRLVAGQKIEYDANLKKQKRE
jgi:hypothetical protein